MQPPQTQAALLLDPLPVPAFLWEQASERFIASNQPFLDFLGYTSEELCRLDWRELIVPDEIPAARRAIEMGPTMHSVRWHLRRKDGSVVAVTLASRRIEFIDDSDNVRDVYIGIITSTGERPTIPAAAAFPE